MNIFKVGNSKYLKFTSSGILPPTCLWVGGISELTAGTESDFYLGNSSVKEELVHFLPKTSHIVIIDLESNPDDTYKMSTMHCQEVTAYATTE